MEKIDVVFSSIGAEINNTLPTIFYFALSAEESLHKDPYNQPALALAKKGYRVYSTTLPFHAGTYESSKEAIGHYIRSFKEGKDPLSPFIESAAQKMGQMAQKGEIDLSKTVLMGLSRGGLIAAHLAAQFPQIPYLYLFAPLVCLSECEEAQKQSCDPSILKHWDLSTLTPLLANRHIHISIGNQDLRVSTHKVIQWFLDLVAKANHPPHMGIPIELKVFPSIGWQGHGTPQEIFEQCAKWVSKKVPSL